MLKNQVDWICWLGEGRDKLKDLKKQFNGQLVRYERALQAGQPPQIACTYLYYIDVVDIQAFQPCLSTSSASRYVGSLLAGNGKSSLTLGPREPPNRASQAPKPKTFLSGSR